MYFSKRQQFFSSQFSDFVTILFLYSNLCGLFFGNVVQAQDFKCPSPSEITPCTCEVNAKGENVTCAGSQVTQESVDNCFKLIRQINNISSPKIGSDESIEKDWLYLHEFGLHSTQLTEFDWSPLIQSRIEAMDIKGNPYLSKLVGPVKQKTTRSNSNLDEPTNLGSIEVNSLTIQRNSLTEEGFGNTFRYFSSALQSLDLRRNLLTGAGTGNRNGTLIERSLDNEITSQTTSDSETEFLPGFSTLKHLVYLDLAQNNIFKLNGPLFKQNTKLSVLYLSNNPIVEIGKDAFLFDDVPLTSGSELTDDHLNEDKNAPGVGAGSGSGENYKNQGSRRMFISLFNNSLNEDQLDEFTGLERFKGRVYLNLEFNRFTTLPQRQFQRFLDAQIGNTINLFENPLICDQRLLWLRENMERYEKYVRFAECSNDRGQSVFTTNLILSNNLK